MLRTEITKSHLNNHICQHRGMKTSTVTPSFYCVFNTSLYCNDTIPSFIGNLWRVLLLGNHLNSLFHHLCSYCYAAQHSFPVIVTPHTAWRHKLWEGLLSSNWEKNALNLKFWSGFVFLILTFLFRIFSSSEKLYNHRNCAENVIHQNITSFYLSEKCKCFPRCSPQC